MLISHPSPTVPLQSRKPVLHVPTRHCPVTHAGAAFGVVQFCPQPPQCASVVFVSVSQPSLNDELQLPRPALQVPTAHEPVVHWYVETFGAVHTLPHEPQFSGSLASTKPSSATPSQSSSMLLHVS